MKKKYAVWICVEYYREVRAGSEEKARAKAFRQTRKGRCFKWPRDQVTSIESKEILDGR